MPFFNAFPLRAAVGGINFTFDWAKTTVEQYLFCNNKHSRTRTMIAINQFSLFCFSSNTFLFMARVIQTVVNIFSQWLSWAAHHLSYASDHRSIGVCRGNKTSAQPGKQSKVLSLSMRFESFFTPQSVWASHQRCWGMCVVMYASLNLSIPHFMLADFGWWSNFMQTLFGLVVKRWCWRRSYTCHFLANNYLGESEIVVIFASFEPAYCAKKWRLEWHCELNSYNWQLTMENRR